MKSQSRLVNVAVLWTYVVNLRMEPKFFVRLNKEHKKHDMMCTKTSISVGKSSGYTNSCNDFTDGATILYLVK
jgi:hypothetical protein